MFSVVASLPTTARGVTTRITTGLRLRGREEGDDVGRRRRQQQQQCCSSLCFCCCGADGGKTFTSPDEKKRPTKGRRPFLSSPPHLTTTKTTRTSSRRVFDVSTKAVAYPNEREDKQQQQQQHEREHHQQLIKKGDRIPTSSLQYFDHEGNLQSIETSQLCSKGKTIVVFAVPGAFLPTCTNKHLPGFIDLAAKMKQAGCDLYRVRVRERRVRHGRVGEGCRRRSRADVRRR